MGAVWTPPNWHWDGEIKFKWSQRFAWWPKRSSESKQRIWFEKAWYGYRWIDGPGEPLKVEEWLTDKEYVWYRLKNS